MGLFDSFEQKLDWWWTQFDAKYSAFLWSAFAGLERFKCAATLESNFDF